MDRREEVRIEGRREGGNEGMNKRKNEGWRLKKTLFLKAKQEKREKSRGDFAGEP